MFNLLRFCLFALCLIFVSCQGQDSYVRLVEQPTALVTLELDSGWVVSSPTATQGDTLFYGRSLPASVPGTIHTDLMAAGVIDDPFASTNEQDLQWIEDHDWEYSTTFTPSATFFGNSVKELVFNGLDTYADVYLNDSLILRSDNMFVGYRVDVSGILREGSNRLVIRFASAYLKGLEKAAKHKIKLPADNDKGEVATSVFTRKAPYHFGWDWGPRLLGCGIFRPVELVGWNNARIENAQYTLLWHSDVKACFEARFNIKSTADNNAIHLMISDSLGRIYRSKKLNLDRGDTAISIQFAIKNPILWWPNGMGDAHLYPIHAILANKNDMNKLDCRVDHLGVRTAELIQKKDKTGDGQGFYFRINREPVFAKGANYIPLDVFLPRVTPDRYEEFIQVCKESNFNMLRVWGGGVYESDLFYDLCDRYGIMVWQDFMFACSFYPWDEAFLDNVRQEATYNVQRLRNHPSIVMWCGNNEISEAWHHWGYQKVMKWSSDEQDSVWMGYKSLFEGLLPEVLAAQDTTRAYHPSSPLYGRGNPKSRNQGDSHYWGVFHDEEPFSAYATRPGRFNSEYGFQSLACYDTYREYFSSEELWLGSPAMLTHQKNPKGYRVIEEYMTRDLPVVKDSLRTYIYLTQLLQAEGMKTAIEAHRQNRPFTMGTLYWQANDCWPAASWSSIDSRGRWKALQYYARRLFEPVSFSFDVSTDGKVLKLWGLNDCLVDTMLDVELALLDFQGKELWSSKRVCNVPRLSVAVVDSLNIRDLLSSSDFSKVMLVARAGTLNAIHYFVPFKDLDLPQADYTFEVKPVPSGRFVDVVITARVLLKSVLVESDQLINSASDGYFDMLPGERRTIRIEIQGGYSAGDSGLRLQTLNAIARSAK